MAITGIGKLIKDYVISNLNTTSKTIPGAINELDSTLDNVGTAYNNTASTVIAAADIANGTPGASITLPAGTYIIVCRWEFSASNASGSRNLQASIINPSSSIIARQRIYVPVSNYAILQAVYIGKVSAGAYRAHGACSSKISDACANNISAVRIK